MRSPFTRLCSNVGTLIPLLGRWYANMPYVKTSLMTLGLAERKERKFGRGRPPNTITVAINCRKDGEERQDSQGKEWREGGRGSSQRGRPSPPPPRFPCALHFAPTSSARTKPDPLTHSRSQKPGTALFSGLSLPRGYIRVGCLSWRS